MYSNAQDMVAGQVFKTGADVYSYFMGVSIYSPPHESLVNIVKYVPFLYQDEDSTITEQA